MENKKTWLYGVVAVAVVAAIAIGISMKGSYFQGKMGPISGPTTGPTTGFGKVNTNCVRAADCAKKAPQSTKNKLAKPITSYVSTANSSSKVLKRANYLPKRN
ncbi:MAG: hypothetical protein AAB373_05425 [Patescibacteria group bacterium]